jgi:glycosyltransferase involved in cell wall biosynthesis
MKVLTGSEVYFLEIASALYDLGHEVDLFAPEIDFSFIRKYTGEKVNPIGKIESNYDLIVMSHYPSVINFLPDAPIVNVIHSEIYPLEVPYISDRVVKYVGIRPTICEKLIGEYAVDATKVTLVRNPIDLNRFNSINTTNEKFGLFVGTLGGLRIKALIHFAMHCKVNGLKSIYIGAENEKVPFYDTVLGPCNDIEKYFKNCSISGGIIFGRSYFEARLCGKPTIEYMVNNQGMVTDILWGDEPNEIELIDLRMNFNKLEVAKRIIEV